MGKIGLAVNLAKRTANFVKNCGKRSILQTKPQDLHGINPMLTFKESGLTVELPRFITEEMREALVMNKIAINQAKHPISSTFSKASPSDLKRLTSETIEDTYSRCQWTNPKDGRVYNLLKEGVTDDGKILIRILDIDGAFVKEAVITPKKIVIIDDNAKAIMKSGYKIKKAGGSHGGSVEIFARRNNPFANIEVISNAYAGKIGNHPKYSALGLEKSLTQVIEKLKNGEKIDFINCSWGGEANLKQFAGNYETATEFILRDFVKKEKKVYKLLIELSKLCKKNKTRIIFSSGNGGKDSINILLFDNFEQVGSIGRNGKISEFSASRNSRYTQHYEVGESSINGTGKGLNLTGLPGTDQNFISMPFESELSGKKLEDILISDDEFKQLKNLLNCNLYKECIELKNQILKNRRIVKIKDFINSGFDCGMSNLPQDAYIDLKNHNVYSLGTNGRLMPYMENQDFSGTSFAAPVRTAKLALNEMMKNII